jgi:putative sterol carrier protein
VEGEEVWVTDCIQSFFDRLARDGHQPVLEKATGTVRFDIRDGDRTDYALVRIDRGDLTVSVEEAEADCYVHIPRAVLEDVVCGGKNMMAAHTRGEVRSEGAVELFILIQRLMYMWRHQAAESGGRA